MLYFILPFVYRAQRKFLAEMLVGINSSPAEGKVVFLLSDLVCLLQCVSYRVAQFALPAKKIQAKAVAKGWAVLIGYFESF